MGGRKGRKIQQQKSFSPPQTLVRDLNLHTSSRDKRDMNFFV